MIPMNPQKRSGNPGSFSSTNMGIIGFAVNGVPIFNPYKSYDMTARVAMLDFMNSPHWTCVMLTQMVQGTSFSPFFGLPRINYESNMVSKLV